MNMTHIHASVATITSRQQKKTKSSVGTKKTDASATLQSKAVWSSGVPFYPPSTKYWCIGGKWYDFTDFLDKHPGGAEALLASRDRFEDATFVFESHHHEYHRARAVIRKYEVPEEVANSLRSSALSRRPQRAGATDTADTHHDAHLDKSFRPKLLGDDAFYSVLRKRVAKYLKESGHRDGGPTRMCLTVFTIVTLAWFALMYATFITGSTLFALAWGAMCAWLGAFGHNWVHQPWYYSRGFALLSLDTIGFSSVGWYREHNLQHHMYTNTPWDNHFRGVEPFLVTDPTVPRNFMQQYILPFMNPLVLTFGVWGNYIAHLTELVKGNESVSIGKVFLPVQIAVLMYRWGFWHGLWLMYVSRGVCGVYYFTMALMNHNAEHCTDVTTRNASTDWGVAQLNSSADWGVNMTFLQAIVYLWLNYHTVHHLFPKTDMSHHPRIQAILMETVKEFGVDYVTGSPFAIYKQMVQTFAKPSSLAKEILVYGGGI